MLAKGGILESILASTAIPGVFPPVVLGGRTLLDGVVATGTPIATAVRLGATRLIVMPRGFTCVGKAVPKHPIGRAMHAITLLGARQLRQDYTHYSEKAQLCPLAQSSYDYSNGAALFAAARDSTRAWLDEDGLAKAGFPGQLEVHAH